VRRRPRRLVYLALSAVLFFSVLPLYYSLVVASQDNSALAKVPPPLLFGGNLLTNIHRVFEAVPFGRALINSMIVSTAVTVSVVLFSTLAGFAFAKMRFRGRNTLLLIIVGTMMVPTQLGIIPLYILMAKISWTDSLLAVIVPALVNAFGVFFMTQYLSEALPVELLEAGRIDGCTTLRLFRSIVLPIARPAAAVLGMLTFLATWNDYLWPLVVLQSPEQQTVQVTLSKLRAGYIEDFSLSLTGTAMAIVPLLIVFIVLGKQLVGGIMQGAVKG
jgi:cellobiose transport system permease protein